MNGTIKLAVPLVAALALAACNAGGYSSMPSTGTAGTAARAVARLFRSGRPRDLAHAACPEVRGKANCLALIDDVKPGPFDHGMMPQVSTRRLRLVAERLPNAVQLAVRFQRLGSDRRHRRRL